MPCNRDDGCECVTIGEAAQCGWNTAARLNGLAMEVIEAEAAHKGRVFKTVMTPLTGAVKHDAGKAPLDRGLFSYFPRALEAVAFVSQFGYEKYQKWGGWRGVDDGLARYSDAGPRHRLLEKLDDYDEESRYLHAAHEAWNALARLEKMLEDGKELRRKQFFPLPKTA